MLPAPLRFFSTFTVTPLLSGRRDSGTSAAVEELKVGPGVAEPRPQLRRSWALCPQCGSTLRPAAPSCAAGLRCALTRQQPLRESVSGYSSSPVDSPLTRLLIGSLTAPPAGGHRASGDMLNQSMRRVRGEGERAVNLSVLLCWCRKHSERVLILMSSVQKTQHVKLQF